jgi:cytochrome b6-f complex iron-sulfur subunit
MMNNIGSHQKVV